MASPSPQSWRSPRPRKIIQVFNRYLKPGGEESSVIRIGEDLAAAGHQVTRFWRASEEWKSPGAPSKLAQPFRLLNNGPVLDELERLQVSEPADFWILHNIVPVVSLGIYRRARALGVPILQWLHNYRPISVGGTLYAGNSPRRPEDPWGNVKESLAGNWNGRLLTSWLAWAYWRLRRRGDYASVQAWIAVSEEMKNVFARAGWFPNRLFSLRHSWHWQASPEVPPDAGHFLFLGRMIEAKGIRFLISLWRRPEFKARPLIMAGDGPLAKELKPLAPPNVQWVGYVTGEQKRKLIAGCRAILFPCIWPEPLSTVAYEAYELSRPVLSSDIGGMREVIANEETGRLLPPQDEAKWTKAILSLDADTAQRWGQNGRRWLEKNASSTAWSERFETILNAVGRAEPLA